MTRKPILAALVTAMLLSLPAPALAAAPPTTYQQVIPVEGFETAYPSRLTVTPVESTDESKTVAYWGRVTQRHSSAAGSSYGLWCAGTPVDTNENGWVKWSGLYPAATRGTALFWLPELADYYASRLDFAYTMPSLGASEAQLGFIPAWSGSASFVPVEPHDWIGETSPGEWRTLSWELGSATNIVNLSGTPGWIKFQFYDFTDDTPAIAEGATIDDVSVTGLKYGPVRHLTVTQSGSHLVLAWDQPYRSTKAPAAVDARTKTFSVWRAHWGQNDWTELASALTGTTYEDATTVLDTPYEYKVQARDPIPGDRYGVVAPAAAGTAASRPAIAVEVTPSASSARPGDAVTFTYRIRNAGTGILSSVRVNTGTLFGSIDASSTLAEGAECTVTRTKTLAGPVSAGATAYGTQAGKVYSAAATLTSVAVAPFPTRVAGTNRFETAVAISKQGFANAASIGPGKAVVVANGYGWADALPASSLAGALGGPLLLVAPDSVPSAVSKELTRLKGIGVRTAYVVGGDAVVGAGARKAIGALGLGMVRVEGNDRYSTAAAVAEKTRTLRGSSPTGGIAFVATGLNFPDALAASSIAAATRGPIVLTPPDALPSSALGALAKLQPSRIVICGGTPAVSAAVQSKLASLYPGKVVRQSGNNRYDTAKALVAYGKSLTGVTAPGGILLATGANYPDALAGGVLAGIGAGAWKPLMLTEPARLSSQASSLIAATPSLAFASVLGGSSAVSEGVRTAAVELVK